MSELNETQVIIAGRVLTLTGYETAEYTQRVGNYINKKLDECKVDPGFKKQNKETQMLMLAINVTDDYMKIVEKLEENEQIIKEKDKEIYNLKHDIITTQQRLDKADEQVKTLQDKIADSSKKLLQLDAKINNRGRKKASDSDAAKDEKVSEPVKAPEPAKSPDSVKVPVPPKTSDTVKLPEPPKTSDSVKLPESPKPPKPSDESKFSDSPKPSDDDKAAESQKTTEVTKVPEPSKDSDPEGSVSANVSGSIGFNPGTKPRLVKDE